MILRKDINRALTHDEMDANFKELEAKTQIALLSKTDDIIKLKLADFIGEYEKLKNLIELKKTLEISSADKIKILSSTAYIKNGVYYVSVHFESLEGYEERNDYILSIKELKNPKIFIQTFDGNILTFENGHLQGKLKKSTQYALSFSGVL